MNTSILNFTLIQSPETKYSDAQIFLQEFTGNSFSRDEAESIWSQVLDHKWNVSNRLQRDIGLRVAAIDYVENFIEPRSFGKRQQVSGFYDRIWAKTKKITRALFELKGQSVNY